MSEELQQPRFLMIAEVASALRVNPRTVRRHIKAGKIRKVPMEGRLVRVSTDELERLAGRPARTSGPCAENSQERDVGEDDSASKDYL